MLCAIADTGNMTRAEGTLYISQSALSQQLKDIEGRLKVDLLFRTRKRMLLTPIGNSDNLTRELEAKRYDLIITAAPVADDYDSVGLFEDQMVCIMPEDHRLSVRPFVRLEDFTGFNLIAHVEKGQHGFYQCVFRPKGIEPQRFMAVGQPQAIVEMVASGFGISVSPRWP